MNLIYVMLFSLISAQSVGVSRGAEAPKLFEIGMTEEDMVARFGSPAHYLVVDTRQHVSAADYNVICAVELCRPIYERKTALNEYEILIFQTVDASTSRLHPTLRVHEISFTLDRNMTPEQAIADIDEARALCVNGCEFSTRSGSMFVATPDGKRYLVFHGDDPLQSVRKNTPISKVTIADLKF